jgi:hypothetical protein
MELSATGFGRSAGEISESQSKGKREAEEEEEATDDVHSYLRAVGSFVNRLMDEEYVGSATIFFWDQQDCTEEEFFFSHISQEIETKLDFTRNDEDRTDDKKVDPR